eukprot:5778238-Pyramimonas_sp.AAC.1
MSFASCDPLWESPPGESWGPLPPGSHLDQSSKDLKTLHLLVPQGTVADIFLHHINNKLPARLDSVALGLKLLDLDGMTIRHIYASDVDKTCRTFLANNFKYELGVFDSIESRTPVQKDVLDIYSAGWPCQPFSAEGLQEGITDSHGRGVVGLEVLDKIRLERPNTFILENVANMVRNAKHRPFFDSIIEGLSSIKNAHGAPEYMVHHKVLNTCDFGIPHSRNRVFIIGYKIDMAQIPWQWPGKMSPTRPVEAFFDPPAKNPGKELEKLNITNLKNMDRAMKDIRSYGLKMNKPIFIDLDGGKNRSAYFSPDVCPCLTRNRAGAGGWWVTSLRRRMTTKEMLRFQGIPTGQLNTSGITDRQFRLMIGNGWSLNISARVTANLLRTVGLARPSSSLKKTF